MKPTPRENAIGRVAPMLEELVSSGCYSRDDAELVVRAESHAVDPWFAEGFAVAVAHHDPKVVPIAETLEMLIEERVPFSLRWTPEKWVAKHEQLTRARELRKIAGDYARRAKWLTRFLESEGWDRRRVQFVTNPHRLLREALRQRISIERLVRRLECGRIAIASVLVDGRRWTVLLRPRSRWRKREAHIHRILGRAGVRPDSSTACKITEILGLSKEPEKRRDLWPSWGQVAVAGLGLLAARWIAHVEPLAPRIPELLLIGAGVMAFAACRYLTRLGRAGSWASSGIFALIWLSPPALGVVAKANPIPVYSIDFAEASGLTAQLVLVPASYFIAALVWPAAAKMMGTHRERAKSAEIA